MGLEKPNSGPDPGETFFPNSVSDLGSAETFQISGNPGLDVVENVCLLDSQPCMKQSRCILLRNKKDLKGFFSTQNYLDFTDKLKKFP